MLTVESAAAVTCTAPSTFILPLADSVMSLLLPGVGAAGIVPHCGLCLMVTANRVVACTVCVLAFLLLLVAAAVDGVRVNGERP